MIFPTVEFASFFAVVLTCSWLLMSRQRLWKPFILAASYVFYGYADIRFCALLAASTLVNQTAATVIARNDPRVDECTGTRASRRRWALRLAVVSDLALLGAFKYLGFFVVQIDELLDRAHLGAPLPLLHIVLPVGISFFTFQGISYVVDVHRGDVPPGRWLDFAVYQAFFPHLVAGPIVRAREFLPQLAAPRDRQAVPVGRAMGLILGGLVKKVVIADLLATRLVDPVFGSPAAHSGLETLVAIYAYAVQIYCDFSAYSDLAIGLALLLGFRFPVNFDRPYSAASLQEFWRRWHMTLSSWLRDYLYVPLGGNRHGAVRTTRNLAVTMLLGGLWHGAAWTFVIWGAIHGTGLVVERFCRSRFRWRWPALGRVAGPLITFHVVCLAWVFFRAPTLGVALEMLGRLGSWGTAVAGGATSYAVVLTPAVLAAVAAGLAAHYVPVATRRRIRLRFSSLPVLPLGLVAGVALVVVLTVVGQQGVAPFIYYRF